MIELMIALRFIDNLFPVRIVTGERDYEVAGQKLQLTGAKPNSPQPSVLIEYTFTAPNRIGLRSYMRLSGVLVKSILDYVTRRFNASSAGMNKGRAGPTLGPPLYEITSFNWSPSQPK